MHDPAAQGSEFFKCDFCRRAWAEDRPMVEGHQGSLICSGCLTAAFVEVINSKGGVARSDDHEKCTMCLETRDDPHWRSPMFETALICRRCIRQSAQAMSKDPDSNWKRPAPPPGAIADAEDDG